MTINANIQIHIRTIKGSIDFILVKVRLKFRWSYTSSHDRTLARSDNWIKNAQATIKQQTNTRDILYNQHTLVQS